MCIDCNCKITKQYKIQMFSIEQKKIHGMFRLLTEIQKYT